MIRECKGLCCKLYPDARRSKPHYWDYLGYKLCNICCFLVKVNECEDIKCQCCITKFRTKVRNPQQRQTAYKDSPLSINKNNKDKRKIMKRVRRFINDYSDIACCICGSKETTYNDKKHRPIWYKHLESYYCRKCYSKVYYKTKRDLMIAQGLTVIQKQSKNYLF